MRPEHLESRLEALEARCEALEAREGSRDTRPPSVPPGASRGSSCDLDMLATLAAYLEHGRLSDHPRPVAARHLRRAIAVIERVRRGDTRPDSLAMAGPGPDPTGSSGE